MGSRRNYPPPRCSRSQVRGASVSTMTNAELVAHLGESVSVLYIDGVAKMIFDTGTDPERQTAALDIAERRRALGMDSPHDSATVRHGIERRDALNAIGAWG